MRFFYILLFETKIGLFLHCELASSPVHSVVKQEFSFVLDKQLDLSIGVSAVKVRKQKQKTVLCSFQRLQAVY
jgi:hypothetical protein